MGVQERTGNWSWGHLNFILSEEDENPEFWMPLVNPCQKVEISLCTATRLMKRKTKMKGELVVILVDTELEILIRTEVEQLFQQKWQTKLLGLDYEIQYRRGVKNSAANALSRKDFLAEEHYQLLAIATIQPKWIQEVWWQWLEWVEEMVAIRMGVRGKWAGSGWSWWKGWLLADEEGRFERMKESREGEEVEMNRVGGGADYLLRLRGRVEGMAIDERRRRGEGKG
ncbi:hypothetical protein ACH5RR_002535 [Cinchona calisaya]|uniref:Uncharacterized protein n=1 Tax=Cinchona calisaya TaxID=153742 RepID=A0ABD3AS80_9GENT